MPVFISAVESPYADTTASGVARTLPLPAGVSAGDFMLMFLNGQVAAQLDRTFSTGWEPVQTSQTRCDAYGRFVTAADISAGNAGTVTVATANKTSYSISAWSGVDSVAPWTNTVFKSSSSSTTYSTPAATATGYQVAVRAIGIRDNPSEAGFVADAGVTTLTYDSNFSGTDCALLVGYDTSTYADGDSIPEQGWTNTVSDAQDRMTVLLNGSSGYYQSSIVLESYSQPLISTSGTNSVIDAPAGVQEGDLLLFVLTCIYSGSLPRIEGFTTVAEESGPDGYDTAVAYRFAGSSEPATYTLSGTHIGFVSNFFRFSGVDTNSVPALADLFFDDSNPNGTGNFSEIEFPSVATVEGSCIVRISSIEDDNQEASAKYHATYRPSTTRIPIVEQGAVDMSQQAYVDFIAKDGTSPATNSSSYTADDKVAISIALAAAPPAYVPPVGGGGADISSPEIWCCPSITEDADPIVGDFTMNKLGSGADAALSIALDDGKYCYAGTQEDKAWGNYSVPNFASTQKTLSFWINAETGSTLSTSLFVSVTTTLEIPIHSTGSTSRYTSSHQAGSISTMTSISVTLTSQSTQMHGLTLL